MKNRLNAISLLLLSSMGMQGCAIGLVKSLHDVSYLEQAPIPSGVKTHEVKKDISQNVVLSFIMDTNYVNEGWTAFQKSCPNGTILNPFVRYSTDLGFFAYKHQLHFSGTCVEGKNVD